MFTWICPKCGREVPPAYAECPTCAERQQAAAAAPPPPAYGAPAQPVTDSPPLAAPPPPPAYAQPAVAPPPPPPPSYSAPPAYAPPPMQTPAGASPPGFAAPEPAPRRSFPPWLAAIGVAVILIGALAVLYQYVLRGDRNAAPAAPPAAAAPSEVTATTVSGDPHPYAKSLEITGIRILEEKGKVQVRFSAVNHSMADMAGLAVRGALHTPASKPEDPPVATFEAQIGSLAANESKDVTAPASTKLRAYELPDWQFLRAQVEITSPR